MARPSKQYTSREQIEGRCFWAIVYEDSTEYDIDIVLNRLGSYWDKFYYVKHDNDFYSSYDLEEWEAKHSEPPEWQIGDKKKNHYHIIGYRQAPLCLGLAAQKFGIPTNYVQKPKSVRGAVRYLRHLDQPWKTQYETDLVISNDPDIEKYWKCVLEDSEKASILMDFIYSSTHVIYLRDLVFYAIKSNCYDELRRGQHLYTALIKERNEIFRGNDSFETQRL